MEEPQVVLQSILEIKPNPHNARKHGKRQIRQIAESIRVFGFTNPVLIDAQSQIVAGHGRVEAATLLGMTEVPTIRLDWLTREQIRAYALADNKLALKAGWDMEILAIELDYLQQLEVADFDVTITGFEVSEIDLILEEASVSSQPEEAPPEPAFDQEPVTSPGDLWLLGKHRIICGNSLHQQTYQALLGSRRAAAVFTDPPFNVRIDGHATGNGTIRHREFAMASGEMSEAEFVSFLNNSLRLRLTFPTLKRAAKELYERFRPRKVVIEDKASGTSLIQELKNEGLFGIEAYQHAPGSDKFMRTVGQSIKFESGQVLLPTEAPWLDDYVRELTGFPGAKFDDQVDSTTQALDFMSSPACRLTIFDVV